MRQLDRVPVVVVLVLAVAGTAPGCGAPSVEVETAPVRGAPVAQARVSQARVAQAATTAFPGIFPFTTQAELDAYASGSDQTFRDPGRTAREFAARYLGFTAADVVFSEFQAGEPGAGEVAVSTRRGDQNFLRTTVSLRQLGPRGPNGPWTVVAANSPDISVDRPQPLEQVASPVAVSGRGRGFEGTISLEIREDGMVFGQSLGRGFAMGGATEVAPFSGSLAFAAPSRPGGAVLFQDRSAVGPPEAVNTTVVRVLFRGVALTG